MKEKIVAKNFCAYYGEHIALKDINLQIYENEIIAVIGPANSGKTTFLRSLNRLNDSIKNFRVEGELKYDEMNVYDKEIDVATLRRLLGMVFAVPIPLPGTIYYNLTFGPKIDGIKRRIELDKLVEESLKAAYLWDEVKERLNESVFNLSGGQQQRLCLARTIALQPDVLLLDEPCSGLDPISTQKIEEALRELKKSYTIVLVTNNVMQASRVSDRTAFFLMGEVIEVSRTYELFTNPKDKRTSDYITGRFG